LLKVSCVLRKFEIVLRAAAGRKICFRRRAESVNIRFAYDYLKILLIWKYPCSCFREAEAFRFVRLMRRNVSGKLQNFSRWFLLISVLTGIFFSGGEGIQLFPFSAATEKHEDCFSFQKGKHRSYSPSVYNSAAHAGFLKSKSQKFFRDFICGGASACDDLHSQFVFSPPKKNFLQKTLFRVPGFRISPSDRAPPFI
jgi:hypothetical protein